MSSPTDFDTAPDEFVDSLSSNVGDAAAGVTPTNKKSDVASERDGQTNESDADEVNVKQEEKKGASPRKNIEDRSQTSAAATEAHAETLAADNSNGTHGLLFSGMSFYLNRDASAHDSATDADQLDRLIETNGGKTLSQLPKLASNSKDVFVVSPYNDTRLPTVTPTYIRACCQNNTLLKIENYLVPFDEFRSVIDTQLHDEHDEHGEHRENGAGTLQDESGRAKHDFENGTIFDTNAGESNNENSEGKEAEDDFKTGKETDAIENTRQSSETGVAVNIPVTKPEGSSRSNNETDENGEPLAEIVDHDSSKINDQGTISRIPQEAYSEHSQSTGVQHENNAYDSTRTMLARANMPTHNKASFTEAEDEFILDVVRKNPTRRTTHTLYDEISHYVPNHTGNSIRHRFRVYLSKRLEFVYEVDKYGKLIRDENGNLIKTKILPPSIKKKFTADEDYSLAIGIKKQFYRDLYQIDPDTGVSLITDEDSPTAVAKRNMTMDPNHVPGTEPSFPDYRVNDRRGPIAREFFKQFGEVHSTHTENAWRDRFRKFLLTYGIDNYIQYYEAEKSQGNVPEPMKNLTNRVKRPGIPTPGNYNSAAKRARIYGADKTQQASTSSVADTAAAAAAAVAAGNASGHMEAGTGHYAIPESELLDEDTMNFISSLKNDLSKIDSSIPFEYPQEIAEAIRNDFSNEEAEYDNINPDSIPFPPEIASIDLFLPQFFRMSSTGEFLEKVHEVISRDYEPSQAEKLVQDLCDEAGVRKTFSTSILTALSGDLMVFPRYFLNMFKHNVNPPPNVPGIWTREDDRMLRSNKEEDIRALTKRHGTGRMEMRKKFVEKDLI